MTQDERPEPQLLASPPMVLRPAGELDLLTAPELTQGLDAAFDSGRDVVLDLRGLDFMDVVGMHAVLAADDRARSAGRPLRLIRGGSSVGLVLELTGVDGRLSFAGPELAAAVDAGFDAQDLAGARSAAAAQLAAPVIGDAAPGAGPTAGAAFPGGTLHSADAAREARTEARLLSYLTDGGPVT